jgi:perosamine synthetase
MNLRIPLAKPEITSADREAVLEVLQGPHLSMGPKLAEFEEAIAAYLRSPYAVAVNSGTSALHLAIRGLSLPPGAEVILPSFTFGAVLNVLLQEKLQPVFVEIDPRTMNTTPEYVERAITSRTKAILAVHTFGRPVAADELRKIADHNDISLIEDACEALGAEVGTKKAGTWGHAGTLAFYPNKQITTGEGGILLTPDRKLAEQARRLRNQGRDPSLGWYQHAEIGYSYRLAEMNCALGISQLRHIDSITERRQSIAERYNARLESLPEVIPPPTRAEAGRISWFAYVVQLTAEFDAADRDYLSDHMHQRGIGVARYFAPLHRQPVLSAISAESFSLPNTESVAARVLALPFFNQLTEAEINDVCDALQESLNELHRRKT